MIIKGKICENKPYDNNYIITTDMEGNIRICRLPKGCGPYQDPRAVCLS
jgi:hypothetical protein